MLKPVKKPETYPRSKFLLTGLAEFVTALTIMVTACGYLRVSMVEVFSAVELKSYFSPIDFFYVGLKSTPAFLTVLVALLYYKTSIYASGRNDCVTRRQAIVNSSIAYAGWASFILILLYNIYRHSDTYYRVVYSLVTSLPLICIYLVSLYSLSTRKYKQSVVFDSTRLIIVSCATYMTLFFHPHISSWIFFRSLPEAERAMYGDRKGSWPRKVDEWHFEGGTMLSEPKHFLMTKTTEFFIFLDTENRNVLVVPQSKFLKAVLVPQ